MTTSTPKKSSQGSSSPPKIKLRALVQEAAAASAAAAVQNTELPKPSLPLPEVTNVIPENVKSVTLTGGKTNPIVLSSAASIEEVVDPTTPPNSNKGLEDYIRSHGVYLCDSNGNVVETIHDPLQPSNPNASRDISNALQSLSKNASMQNYLRNFINTDQNGLLWAARARDADELQKGGMELGVTQVGSKVPGYETKVYFIPNSDGSLDVRVTNVINRIASYGFKMDEKGNPINAEGTIVHNTAEAVRDIDVTNEKGLLAYDTTYRLSPIENGAKVKAEVISTTEAVIDQRVEQYLPHLKSQNDFESYHQDLVKSNVQQDIKAIYKDLQRYMGKFDSTGQNPDKLHYGSALQSSIRVGKIGDLTQKILENPQNSDARAQLLLERSGLEDAIKADREELSSYKNADGTYKQGADVVGEYLKSSTTQGKTLLQDLDKFLQLTEPAVAATSVAAATQATTPSTPSTKTAKAGRIVKMDPVTASLEEIARSLEKVKQEELLGRKVGARDEEKSLAKQVRIFDAATKFLANPNERARVALCTEIAKLENLKAQEGKKFSKPQEILLQNLQGFLYLVENKVPAPTAVAARNTVAPTASQTTTTTPEPALPAQPVAKAVLAKGAEADRVLQALERQQSRTSSLPGWIQKATSQPSQTSLAKAEPAEEARPNATPGSK